MSEKKPTKQNADDLDVQAFEKRIKAFKQGTDFDALCRELPRFKTRTVASYDDQIRILEKRGCLVAPDADAEEHLRQITYYRLKGYFQESEQTYLKFKDACAIHEFDAQMRALLSHITSKIEIFLRSQFCYVYCYKYSRDAKIPDAYAYLKTENYRDQAGYHKMLNTIQAAVKRNKDTPFVRHYLAKYGGLMPLWVVIEQLDFGGLVTFYKNWTPFSSKALLRTLYGDGTRRYHIVAARENGNQSTRFISWLLSCNYLRNLCAHGGRLYRRPLTQLPNFPDEFSENPNEKNDGKICGGNKDFLWGALLALQFLYPNQDEWDKRVGEIKRLLEMAKSELKVETPRLLFGMGFPEDWEHWLQRWREIQ